MCAEGLKAEAPSFVGLGIMTIWRMGFVLL